jgi:hypothetical protein
MIYALIFTHWIADFIVQTDAQAKGKSTSLKWLSKHIATYTLCMSVFGCRFAVVNGLLHFVVDYFTSKATRYFYSKGETHNFFIVVGFDQALHLSALVSTMWMINFGGI